MITSINHTQMGRGVHGWLDSHFHFSFAEYYNPGNIHFGALRVLNDDLVQCGRGFDTHPHENMEIISYVVNGELTHRDSMGNERTLTRGQIQYMSAGTGVTHSEYNHGNETLRFLQIWLFPDKNGYTPDYGDVQFAFEDRRDQWLPLAASADNRNAAAPVKIHTDCNAYASFISPGLSLDFTVSPDRQAYLALIEGNARLQGRNGSAAALFTRDAAEITGESFTISAPPDAAAHVLIIEMAQDRSGGR